MAWRREFTWALRPVRSTSDPIEGLHVNEGSLGLGAPGMCGRSLVVNFPFVTGVFRAEREVLADFDEADKVILPEEALHELQGQGGVEFPLHFALSAADSSRTQTFVGVQEFSAPRGTILIPRRTCAALALKEEDEGHGNVVVRYQKLPKARKLILQPLTADFSDIPTPKNLLESSLKHKQVVSTGDVFRVRFDHSVYELRVTQVEPSDVGAVTLIDTDCVVEFAPAAREGRQAAIRVPLDGPPIEGTVEPRDVQRFCVMIPKSHNPTDREIVVRAEPLDQESDPDLMLSRDPRCHPSMLVHEMGAFGVGAVECVLRGSDRVVSNNHEDGTGTAAAAAGSAAHTSRLGGPQDDQNVPLGQPGDVVYIGVTTWQSPCRFRLIVATRPISAEETNEANDAQATVSEEPRDAESRVCPHCNRSISTAAFASHEAFCGRHMRRCPFPGCERLLRQTEFEQHVHCNLCGSVETPSSLPKHEAMEHAPIACSCGVSLPRLPMQEHQRASCPFRPVRCRFCAGFAKAGRTASDPRDRMLGLTGHESVCGARTEPCPGCGDPVMLKWMESHMKAKGCWERALRGEPVERVAVASDDEDDNTWECPQCTLRNSGSTCDACGASREQGDDNEVATSAVLLSCRNDACSQRGLDRLEGLCARCARLILFHDGEPVTEESMNDRLRRIVPRYHRQLAEGCGSAGCLNVCCATGRRQALPPGRAAAVALQLARHAMATEPRERTYHVCVESRQALPEAQNPGVEELASAPLRQRTPVRPQVNPRRRRGSSSRVAGAFFH